MYRESNIKKHDYNQKVKNKLEYQRSLLVPKEYRVKPNCEFKTSF